MLKCCFFFFSSRRRLTRWNCDWSSDVCSSDLPDNLAQTLTSNNFVPQFRGFDIFGPAVVGPIQIQQAGIDINQRTSYSLQWTFTVQRELRRKMVVEAGYMAS